jgi:tRNA pseudouridine38-40 synthase
MRFRLLIEYDGTDFSGWQVQSGEETVQGQIERALATVFKKPISIVGAGRTDAGVHARGQVAHFDSDDTFSPRRLQKSLNGILKRTVRIKNIESCEATFHARFGAKSRTYHYQISAIPQALCRHFVWHISYNLNIPRMQDAAQHITGTHNFQGFCRTLSETDNYMCTVFFANWRQKEEILLFEISANRFLHGMVRALVGTLVDIGRGKTEPELVTTVLNNRDRQAAGQSAPPHGLILEKVEY